MITDILITPVGGEFDMEEIRSHLASLSNAAVDPVVGQIFMLANSGEGIQEAVDARVADPARFPISVALVDPRPGRVDVSYRTSWTVEPARRFVRWLRSAYDVRITDEAFHDITGECDERLQNVFGPWAPPSLDLQPCSLSDLGALVHRYARATLPGGHPVLVVRLEGAADLGIDEIFDLASAIVMAGLEAWGPAGLILDLRQLVYSWGDRMQDVLDAAQRWYEPRSARFPLAVVTSELCRDGLTSLVRDRMGMDPATVLFDSIDEAAAAMDRGLQGVTQP